MSKKSYSAIAVILDKSGSMYGLVDDTIGGFNSFLKENQDVEDSEATLTLAQFSSDYNLVYDNVPIKEIPNLDTDTYQVGGATALLDAIGKTINALDQKLSILGDEEKPESVIVVVMTDGQENSSREFTKEAVTSMIKHREEKYAWEFIFLGAGLDSIKDAAQVGISYHNTVDYAPTSKGLQESYNLISDCVKSHRLMDKDERAKHRKSILSHQLEKKKYDIK